MRRTRIRSAAVVGVALLTTIALAACGGGGSTTTTSSSATANAAARGATGDSGATGGTGAFGAGRSALAACLQKAGFKLPAFGGGRRFGGTGATGASGRPPFFGGTGATGASGGRPRFFGGTGASGASGARGRGFFGGGGAGAFANNPKEAQAFEKCLASVGGFGGGFGGRRTSPFVARSARERAAITSYTACMKSHGVDLPKPNFSGHGSVFGNGVNRSTTAFKNANAACQHLLTFLPPSGATGATGAT